MKATMMRWFVWLVMLSFALTLPAIAAKGAKGDKGHKSQSEGAYETHQKGKHSSDYPYDQESEVEKGMPQKNKEGVKGEKIDSDTGKPDGPPGLAKQAEKKMEQERKELGKGSETGQQKREEHSRKWWKFWE